MKRIINLLLITGSTITLAHAQAPDPDTTAGHFIIMASISNLQEINSGKLAAQKAKKADVRSYGEMMATDHSQSEKQLLQLAKTKGYPIPAAASDTPQPDPIMAKASGDDFDRMYIHSTVSVHRSTVMRFRNYALTGKDPEVRELARQMLPELKEQLKAVKALDEKYKNLTAK